MSEQNNPSYLINLLLSLKKGNLFKDAELFSQLKVLAENYHSEQAAKKAEEEASQFIEFYHKNTSVHPTIVRSDSGPKGVPLRMYVDGVFDMVHSGHFNALRQARQLCDVLVVGVVSDEEVIHHKGPPVMSLEERIELIGACKWVDEVASDNIPYNPTIDLIDKLNCPFVAHGDDLALSADGTDCYSIIKNAGRMKTFKRTHGISTTDIVGRLLLLSRNPQRHESKDFVRKLSTDQHVTSKSLGPVEENKEATNAPQVQLLQTTRRIRQFSSGKEPKAGDKIVYIDGTFDLLHVGHVKILKKAKEQGDFLIVGLHEDEAVEQIKGKNYPVLHLQERVLNILALKYVDEVIIGAPWKITENLLTNFSVNLVVEGSIGPVSELEAQTISKDDPYELPKKMGIYKKLESGSNMTTEGIITRIIDNRNKLSAAHEIKKKKLENYYKSLDNNKVQET